jgi:recombination protein RecT
MGKSNAMVVVDKLRTETQETEIAKALPAHVSPQRYLRLAITMLKDPKLQNCSKLSLMESVMTAAQLGLELDGVLGHAYLVPFKDKATFIVGYRGFIDLATRSGKVSHVDTAVVYEGDTFKPRLGSKPHLGHIPTLRAEDRGKVIAAYVVVHYTNGLGSFDFMLTEDIEKVRIGSPSKNSPAWKNHWNEMAKKTVLRRHLKTRALSPEITRAAVHDEYYEAGVGEQGEDLDINRPGRFGFGKPKEVVVEDVTDVPAPAPEAKPPPAQSSGDEMADWFPE